MRLPCALLTAALLLAPATAEARSTAEHRAARPDLFHPETGLRIARQRAPTPDDVPGAARIGADGARALARAGAILLDVGPALRSRFDDLDGTWLVSGTHRSLPGAVWLPEVGRGTLGPAMRRYLSGTLARLTHGPAHPIVVFCMADCWMSWNAVQRLTALGYRRVLWFAEGTDGWLDRGWHLEPVMPLPVEVD